MKTTLSSAAPAELATEALVAVVLDYCDSSQTAKNTSSQEKQQLKVETSDAAVQAAAADLLSSGEVTCKPFEINLLHKPTQLKAKRLLLVSGGVAKKFTSYDLRRVAGAAARALKARGVHSFAFVAPSGIGGEEAVKAIVEGTFVGNFDPDYYKSDRKDQKIEAVTVIASGDKSMLERALDEAQVIGESQNFTRDLVNEPSNRMTPTMLGERAKKVAQEVGLKCEVYGADKIKELKMGAFWSVAQGSDEPPALIVMKYEPAGAPEKPMLGLVGKGITFDTGGISLKPAAEMDEMKYDMSGAGSVLGTMKAAAAMKLPLNVVGVIPTTENMPGGNATRPGDIVTSMSGQTIEILNTDAEGRLILCDALTYAERFEPAAVIDIATLTGACVIALGHVTSGLFANDDKLAHEVLAAGQTSWDRAWQMPAWEDYQEQLRSNFADMANIGGRPAGSITAACFLARFAKNFKWAHLDIAGTAWKSGREKGSTGRPVPLLTQFLMTRAGW